MIVLCPSLLSLFFKLFIYTLCVVCTGKSLILTVVKKYFILRSYWKHPVNWNIQYLNTLSKCSSLVGCILVYSVIVLFTDMIYCSHIQQIRLHFIEYEMAFQNVHIKITVCMWNGKDCVFDSWKKAFVKQMIDSVLITSSVAANVCTKDNNINQHTHKYKTKPQNRYNIILKQKVINQI